MFKETKYVLIITIDIGESSSIENKIYTYLQDNGIDTNNIIIYKHFVSGSSFEPFLEYLTTKHFLSKGYLIENQVPWFQQKFKYKDKILNGGIPDFSAFHSDVSNTLAKYGIISKNSGVILNMLPLLKNFQEFNFEIIKDHENYKYELIIGEAKFNKNSLDQALKQLLQYQKVELATKLYSIIPDVNNNNENTIGEIYLDNNKLKVNESKELSPVELNNQLKDNKWINNYVKALLLGNLNKREIDILINSFRKKNDLTLLTDYKSYHLLDMILETDIEEIINKIREN